jgi:hypothetical protein
VPGGGWLVICIVVSDVGITGVAVAGVDVTGVVVAGVGVTGAVVAGVGITGAVVGGVVVTGVAVTGVFVIMGIIVVFAAKDKGFPHRTYFHVWHYKLKLTLFVVEDVDAKCNKDCSGNDNS